MWIKYLLLGMAKIPYILVFAIELIEALVCSINFVLKYAIGFLKGKIVPTDEKQKATDKLIREWKEAVLAFKNILVS